jgi:glycosyltransferase involved in cell wall biosynthesis
MKFHILTPLYNSERWIGDNIRMLKAQSVDDFCCVVVDDLSTDDSRRQARFAIDGDPRFQVIQNREKRFALGSAVEAIAHIQPQDEDVLMVVDGDDWLAHDKVLEHLAEVYRRENCWMTYGSYSDHKGVRDRSCRPIPAAVIAGNTIRDYGRFPVHLRTFKFKLWQRIEPEALAITERELKRQVKRALLSLHIRAWKYWKDIDVASLLDASGRFVRRGCDKALMYPLLELAGKRSFFVDEVLYIFNSYDKVLEYGATDIHQKWFTRCIRTILRHKKPLASLSSL